MQDDQPLGREMGQVTLQVGWYVCIAGSGDKKFRAEAAVGKPGGSAAGAQGTSQGHLGLLGTGRRGHQQWGAR